ncbi:MAG: hypothetical protein L6Q40_02020 [Azonexus sp.]|nr:hypothetical protein [Azonexus sp.]
MVSPRFVKTLFFASLALLVAAWIKGEPLPAPDAVLAAMQAAPRQTATGEAPFSVETGGVQYQVKPLYAYELNGLVVSRHDAETWWDFIHKEASDFLNVTDLCVVWGENLRNGVYQRLSYHSGQFTCFVRWEDAETGALFRMDALSNNHLLTVNPALAKKIRSVRIGDQIRFRGYLAEYSHNHGFAFKRGTSTTRDDSGNGACETVYVESFDIVRRGSTFWALAPWLGWLGLLLAIIGWFALPPHVARD